MNPKKSLVDAEASAFDSGLDLAISRFTNSLD
jgi:hypothetical protein